MTNVKISDLNPLTTPDSADELAIVDISAPETKRITMQDVRTYVFSAGINDAIHGNRGGGTLHPAFGVGVNGFVPAPGVLVGNFLRDDGSWQTVNSGTWRQESIVTQNISTDVALTNTLNYTPLGAAAVMLFLNGMLQEYGVGKDYTISGTTITWLAGSGTAVDMATSDVLIAIYQS